MRPLLRAATVAAIIATASLAAGCGEPPSKEMHQAQGAIDAARAAGAERYAPEEYQAAVDALKRSEDAVAQRDYRLALNNALDSLERAQNAARQAATERAQARSLAERTLAEVTTALAAAALKLDAAAEAKVPPKALAGPREVIAATQRQVQEAGTLLGREDYVAAQKVLADRVPALNAAAREIDAVRAAPKAASTRKSR
jgi:flagellar hook-basal body complex protein FliE